MQKFLIILLFPLFLIGDDFTFIVDNTTMVDAYINIFSIIGALFESPDYINLLKLVFLLGGFFTFFSAVLGKNISNSISEFTKYMIIGTTLLTLVFLNKSEVSIKTNNLPTYCTDTNSTFSTTQTTGETIGNIPTLFAWGATVSNQFGMETARLSRLAFSSVTSNTNNLSRADFAESLSSIGKIMTVSMDKIAAESIIPSASTIGSTYVAITNDCILIPAGQDSVYGQQILSTYKTSGNTKETINDYIMNSALVVYKNPTDTNGTIINLNVTAGGISPKNLLVTISGEVKTCELAWTDLNFRLNELSSNKDIACMSSFKDVLSPTTLKVFTGQSILEPQLDNIIINVALANQIADSKSNLASGTNNINEMSYATSKSIAEVTLKSKASGDYLAEMLPYLQMGMRAVLYGFFPFVFVVILLPGGIKVLMEYMKSVIWIELWTPAAAILDMFLNIQATDKFSNMYNNTGMNPMSFYQVFSDASMLSGVAGYLYASVPAITWLILGSTGETLSSLGSGLMGGMSGGADSIVSKNLDSGQQNVDRALKQVSNMTGSSISHVQAMSMEHSANKNAGEWISNQSFGNNNLFKSERGNSTEKIIQGIASDQTLTRNLSAQNAEISDAKFKSESLQTQLQSTGIQDKNGQIQSNNLSNYSESSGVNKAIDNEKTLKSQEFKERFTNKNGGGLVKELGLKEALKDIGDYARTESQITTSNNNGMGYVGQSMVQGIDSAMREHKDQTSMVVQMGREMKYDKDGNFLRQKNGFVIYNDKNIYNDDKLGTLRNINKSLAILNGAKKIGQGRFMSHSSVAAIATGTTFGNFSELGKNLSLPAKLKAQRNSAIIGGGSVSSNTSIIGMSKDISLIGSKGQVFGAISADVNANILTDSGINAKEKGHYTVDSLIADLKGKNDFRLKLKYSGNYKDSNGKIHVDKNSLGYKIVEEAKKRIGLGEGLLGGAIIGSLSKQLLINESNILVASSGNIKTNDLLSGGVGSDRIGLAEARKKIVQVEQITALTEYIKPETIGMLDAFQKLAGYGTIGMSILNNLLAGLDIDRNDKVAAANKKLLEEEKKSKILKDRKEDGNKAVKSLYEGKGNERDKITKMTEELKEKQNSIHRLAEVGSAEELRKAQFEIEQAKNSIAFSKGKISAMNEAIALKKLELSLIDIDIAQSNITKKELNKELKGLNGTTVEKLKEAIRIKSEEEQKAKILKDSAKSTTETTKIAIATNLESDLIKATAIARNNMNRATSIEEKAILTKIHEGLATDLKNAKKARETAVSEASAAIKTLKSLKGTAQAAAAITLVTAGTITIGMVMEATWDDKKGFAENVAREAALAAAFAPYGIIISTTATGAINVFTDGKKRRGDEYIGDITRETGKGLNDGASIIIGGATGFVFGESAGKKAENIVSGGLGAVSGGVFATVNIIDDFTKHGEISNKTRNDIAILDKNVNKFTNNLGDVVLDYADGSARETVLRSMSHGVDHSIVAANMITKGYHAVSNSVVNGTAPKIVSDSIDKAFISGAVAREEVVDYMKGKIQKLRDDY